MFLLWLDGRETTKDLTVAYKERLTADYKTASVNAMLAGVNSYLAFIGREDCRVKPLRVQWALFADESRELACEEYARLVRAAEETQIAYIVQTIRGTSIHVSELRYIHRRGGAGGTRHGAQQGQYPRDPPPRAAAEAAAFLYEKTGISAVWCFRSRR